MTSPTRVLIFPAGEQNSIEAVQALSNHVAIELFGAGAADRLGPAFLARHEAGLPTVQESPFLDALNLLIERWQIDLILPTHDSVLVYLAEHRAELAAIPMVPSFSTSTICRDKSLFYSKFRASAFVPAVYHADDSDFPPAVWVKAREGQGGVGGRQLDTSVEGWRSLIDWGSEVVTEHLPGLELTVDCFSDRTSTLMGVFPRTRDRTLGGISVSGRAIAPSENILRIAEELNATLGFVGMWYFQTRENSSRQDIVMEVSARVSSGQGLTRARGVNLPLLSVYAHLGLPTRLFENQVPVADQRVLTSVFAFDYDYDTVYLDLDDTLIIRGKPYGAIVSMLYQWQASSTSVILLTRHESDPTETLEFHKIHRGLFDRIIHIGLDERKSSCISPERSIFIDNAFAERAEVHDSLGIPVLDVSEVETLRSWVR